MSRIVTIKHSLGTAKKKSFTAKDDLESNAVYHWGGCGGQENARDTHNDSTIGTDPLSNAYWVPDATLGPLSVLISLILYWSD